MKILIFGAGVLGSIYAAKLQEAGSQVTLVARGTRYQQLQEHGVVLRHFQTGQESVTQVPVVDAMPAEEHYDICLVLVQKTQLQSALNALRVNRKIPAFVFMNNTAEGPDAMVAALGRDRVLMGHANAGGERSGHVVDYMLAETMTFGELDGKITERLRSLQTAFEKAGIGVSLNRNIDAWKKYHVALAVPLSYAVYAANGCNYELAKNRHLITHAMNGIREGVRALTKLDYPVEPSKLKFLLYIPNILVVPLFQRVMNTPLLDIGGARHIRNAAAEMIALDEEFQHLVNQSGVPTPSIDKLRQKAGSLERYLSDAITSTSASASTSASTSTNRQGLKDVSQKTVS